MSNYRKNVKTTTLTPEEKIALALKQFETAKRQLLGKWRLGIVRSWDDVAGITGYVISRSDRELSFDTLKLWMAEQESAIKSPLVVEVTEKVEPATDTTDSPIDCLRNNPHVQYQRFQERAANAVLHQLMTLDHHAVGLNAAVGTGKTFIIGALVVELYKRQWAPLVNSISPYRCVYITRASIVEQTERVLRDKFGLRLGSDIDVTNIDQLRAKFGKRLVTQRIVHKDGEEKLIYEWRPAIAPALIVLDEAHAVKNVDSEQSLIMQAYSALAGDHYSVYASATMFTKVIEAKAFAVGTRLRW